MNRKIALAMTSVSMSLVAVVFSAGALAQEQSPENMTSEKIALDSELKAPRPLLSQGHPITSLDGYATPAFGDVNCDGRIDLFVGDFGSPHGQFKFSGEPSGMADSSILFGSAGRVQVLMGTGSEDRLEFETPQLVETADGTFAESPTW